MHRIVNGAGFALIGLVFLALACGQQAPDPVDPAEPVAEPTASAEERPAHTEPVVEEEEEEDPFADAEPGDVMTLMLPGDVPLELVRIPAGEFVMGSPEDEEGRRDNEGPQREIAIASDFWMGKYPVTQRQWRAVLTRTPPWTDQERVLDDPDSPVVYASWNDAHDFIDALNKHIEWTGQGPDTVRLPSEAEWEYATRAGTTTRFYWGDDPEYAAIDDYAWWYGNTAAQGNRHAHVVGQKQPNAFGLYDMSGNVWEWCEDDYHADHEEARADGRARVGWPREAVRVARGGSWSFRGEGARSSYRRSYYPGYRNSSLGFRLAW